MQTQLSAWLRSSQDPTQVANKVKGIILMFSSAIILVGSHSFHITLNANDVVALATDIGGVSGAIWSIYGVTLHAITLLGSRRAVSTAGAPAITG